MPSSSKGSLVLALFLLQSLDPLSLVRGSVFITSPYKGISCSGGSECTVTWADDGLAPLLNDVGPSDFSLFQGTDTLVQQLAASVDVSQTRELTFTPNSKAGPNSNSYWIKLTSLSARNPNDTSEPYTSFSGLFTLDNMSGASNNPVASLTSSILPSSSPSTSGSPSTSQELTNGVVSTTTLSGVAPSGSVSTLSSALSALSAISSAASGSSASGSLTSATGSSSSATSPGSGSGTASAAAGASSSGASLIRVHSSRDAGLGFSLVLFAMGITAGLL